MSWPIPAWIRVSSVIEQAASTQPPPIPIQLEEYSASPGRCGVAVGTVHAAPIEWKVSFFSSVPCTYPAQLTDWFAATTTIGRADAEPTLGPDGMKSERTSAQAASRMKPYTPHPACHRSAAF